MSYPSAHLPVEWYVFDVGGAFDAPVRHWQSPGLEALLRDCGPAVPLAPSTYRVIFAGLETQRRLHLAGGGSLVERARREPELKAFFDRWLVASRREHFADPCCTLIPAHTYCSILNAAPPLSNIIFHEHISM